MSNINVLEMRNVSKKFGDKVIFDDFDLVVDQGEMLCIVGKSGSGKSTLLNMIGMFVEADAGDIKLFGQPLPKENTEQARLLMRDKILYLFQNFALIEDRTVDYNLEIPLLDKRLTKQEKKERKLSALEKVGLKVSLASKVYELSGGEQQRLALTRGYLKEFDLVLADEPTGSLDAENRDTIIAQLQKLSAEGKTIIIVTHDKAVMEQCQRVVRLG